MNDELGVQLQSKYANKFMRAVSVGFRPLEFEFIDGGNGIRFTKQELLELSAVPVPAHPKALKKMFGELEIVKGTANPEELKALVREVLSEELAEFTRRLEAVEPRPSKEDPPTEEDLPVELTRELEDILANIATKE